MFDRFLLPVHHRLLKPLAWVMVKKGIKADHITLVGFGFAVLAFVSLCFKSLLLGLIFIGLNRLCDGLDGIVARLTTPSARGAFLDISLDFIFYALVPLGFGLSDPQSNALPAAVLIASFIGTGASFLAFAAVAAENGLKANNFPDKGIYYLGGLTEGFETIVVFIAFCLWPSHFPALAYGFSALCLITTLFRLLYGWRALTS